MKKRILILLLAVCVLIGLVSCAHITHDPVHISEASKAESREDSSEEESVPTGEKRFLTVHYIDVGQGDCELIEFPDGKIMLIDAGEYDQATKVIRYLQKRGHDRIDYLVASHPHSDHIGALKQIIETLPVGEIYMPDVSTDTPTYIKLTETILKKGIPTKVAKDGVKIETNGEYTIDFFGPVRIVDDLNNDSAVIMIQYGEKKFLFMADAGEEEENTLTMNLNCDVLKVGHHGSYSSSSKTFLLKSTPEIGIISCAKVNDYGHPHAAALNRLLKAGVKLYGTYDNGTIVITCDGTTLTVKTERGEDSEPSETSGEAQDWVLNTSSKKVHCPECENIAAISEKNRKTVHCTLDELYDQGYTDCGECRPGEQ